MSAPRLVSPRRHLAPLDGVRGLAILMVMLCHVSFVNVNAGGPIIRLLGRTLHYGLFGVDLFFVLSGFLITGILVDSTGDPGYFRKFYLRRVLRIFPLYYGVLVLLLLLTPWLRLHWGAMGWLLPLYLQNLAPATICTFSPGSGIALSHLWSLAIEEQFYLLWPAVVFLVRGRESLLRATLIGSAGSLGLRLVLVAAGASSLAIHVTTFCRADSLLLGGALALLYRSPEAWSRVSRLAPWGLLATGALVLASAVRLGPWASASPLFWALWQDALLYSVLAIGFACLIACALHPASRCERFFKTRWLRFLGRYSYGLYVLHVPVLWLSVPLRRAIAHAVHSKLLGVAGAGLVCIAASIALAYLSYHLYEKPFLRLKRYLEYLPGGQPRPQSAHPPEIPVSLEGIPLVNS